MRHAISRTFLAVLAPTLALALLASCQIRFAAPAMPANRYALLVGIEDYPGSYNDLDFPREDVADMRAALMSAGWTVTTLLDSQATRSAILSGIGALSSDPGATILVYYSGHGSADDAGTTYMIPHDGILASGDFAESAWITPAAILDRIGATPAANRVLILDSCNSGGFSQGNAWVDTSPGDYSRTRGSIYDTTLLGAALGRFSSLLGAAISSYGNREIQTLAAAGSGESSYDDPSHSNGAFSYYLLEAAANGDYDGDGFVTVGEAYRYAKSRIQTVWNLAHQNDLGGGSDFLPHISGGTGDIVLF